MFFFLFFFLLLKFSLHPLANSASLQKGAALPNGAILGEIILLILFGMLPGSALMILGRWYVDQFLVRLISF